MKIQSKSIWLVLLLLTGASTYGQATLERAVLGSSGRSFSSLGYDLESTVGQLADRSGATGQYSLSEGFQQGNLNVTNVQGQLDLFPESRVYPVPTADVLHVEPTGGGKALKTQLRLSNLSGQLIRVPENKDGAGNYRLDLSSIPAGTYLLWLKDEASGEQKSWKISKIR